jgi:hypothetical protein
MSKGGRRGGEEGNRVITRVNGERMGVAPPPGVETKANEWIISCVSMRGTGGGNGGS